MTQSYDTPALEVDDNGAVVFRGRVVGEFDGSVLTLNAGWCRLAGLGIKVDGDSTDRRRVILDRSDPNAPATPEKQQAPQVRQEEDPAQARLGEEGDDWALNDNGAGRPRSDVRTGVDF